MAHKVLTHGVLLALLASSCRGFEWKECESKSPGLQTVKDVQLEPDPVPAGSSARFTIAGESKVDVEEGTMLISVYYLSLPVYHKTVDLPEPISEGKFTSSFQENFPAYTPPGHYKVTIQSMTAQETPLLCLEVNFSVTFPHLSWLASLS